MIASGAGLQMDGDNVDLGRLSNTRRVVEVRIGNTFLKDHLINLEKNLTLVPASQAPKIYYNEIIRSFLKYLCIRMFVLMIILVMKMWRRWNLSTIR